MKTETSIKSLPGVEKRGNSIRISFTTRDGTRHKKTYKLDGIVMAPTGPNMKAAMRLVQEIKSEIKLGVRISAQRDRRFRHRDRSVRTS